MAWDMYGALFQQLCKSDEELGLKPYFRRTSEFLSDSALQRLLRELCQSVAQSRFYKDFGSGQPSLPQRALLDKAANRRSACLALTPCPCSVRRSVLCARSLYHRYRLVRPSNGQKCFVYQRIVADGGEFPH